MLFLVAAAVAHQPGLSYIRLSREHVSVVVSRVELKDRLPVQDLDAGRVLIADATLGKVRIDAAESPCSISEGTVEPVEGDGIAIDGKLDCPPGGPWTVEAGYLADMTPGHRTYVEVMGEPQAVLDAGNPRTSFDGVPRPAQVALAFVREGVGHIWLGYDHLLFLFGLLLAAPRLRDMFLVITGFTLAHSITLSLAATGVFTLPPAFVEPAIAASIAFVGIENLFRPPTRRRVWITFLLGLIHGFGFAGALAELGLPRDMLGIALACFNVGVELGQTVVVLVVLPLLILLRRLAMWEGRVAPVLSVGVALMGGFWFIERVAGM